jgi:site-specific DNA-methyltransferase (adenine-specific)
VIKIGEIIFEDNKCTLWNGDCLEVMNGIPDKSVDMILCDLPYGTTACAWDTPIDLSELWKQYKRVIKDGRAIVLFASQPFTSKLVSSNFEWFKYSWVWMKNRATGHVHAKNKPMKIHEDVCVFSNGVTIHEGQSVNRMVYYPQGLEKMPEGTPRRTRHDSGDDTVMSARKSHKPTEYTFTGYPVSVVQFPIEMNDKRFHPTQKPLALCEYLINTYSKEGELVLDNCMGGGSSGVASLNTNRRFIGIELDTTYCGTAKQRIQDIA